MSHSYVFLLKILFKRTPLSCFRGTSMCEGLEEGMQDS